MNRGTVILIVLAVGGVVLYVIPTLVAAYRRRPGGHR